MILIVGLGNPGKEYQNTRHNVGFMVLDKLKQLPPSFTALKPNTFMNKSGEEVGRAINYHKIEPQNIWVIHDDVDLPLGTFRIRLGGSSAGHKGIQSIIDQIKSDNFYRIRVGIGRPTEQLSTDAYVLQEFSPEESKIISKVVDQVADYMVHSFESKTLQEETISI